MMQDPIMINEEMQKLVDLAMKYKARFGLGISSKNFKRGPMKRKQLDPLNYFLMSCINQLERNLKEDMLMYLKLMTLGELIQLK